MACQHDLQTVLAVFFWDQSIERELGTVGQFNLFHRIDDHPHQDPSTVSRIPSKQSCCDHFPIVLKQETLKVGAPKSFQRNSITQQLFHGSLCKLPPFFETQTCCLTSKSLNTTKHVIKVISILFCIEFFLCCSFKNIVGRCCQRQ